jgi:hypothetical protein
VAEIVGWWGDAVQELIVNVDGEQRRALGYVELVGIAEVGDSVSINTTAVEKKLGTGGYDFVISIVQQGIEHPAGLGVYPGMWSTSDWTQGDGVGHIMKARYTPSQHAVHTLEEQKEHAGIWQRELEGMPVLVGQLHSQMIPAAAGLRAAGCEKIVYVMTDGAALPIAFSMAVRAARTREYPGAGGRPLVDATITCGQAFGGDYETVTVHSALLAAKHILDADAAIVCQGPGNAGTGTRYGFSGIEQAGILDTVAVLGGTPIAIVRMSEADKRARHQGVSHHTATSLKLVRSRCIVPLPGDVDASTIEERHDVRSISGADAIVDDLAGTDLPLATMGRTIEKDRVFFLAAAAAGLAVKRN